VLPWWWVHAAVLAGAYVVGSIPFSYLVARLRGVDVRRVGSGNVGATNVLRSAGKAAGLAAFVLDFVKGALAAWIAQRIFGGAGMPSAAAAFAVIGHMYPVWLRFQGGKGVATGAGAFLPLAPAATAFAMVVFAAAAAATRYVSVGSVLGAFALPLGAWLTGASRPIPSTAAAIAVLIAWKHRANLRRIARGNENKLGAPARP
jgi:glycerol-3-phosphate acyltransferase PlsY